MGRLRTQFGGSETTGFPLLLSLFFNLALEECNDTGESLVHFAEVETFNPFFFLFYSRITDFLS